MKSSSKSDPSVAQVLAAALKRHGVSVVFGQSIPTALFRATPALGLRQFGYRTENSAGVMADGYARVSGRTSVIAAQNGPAATLLVPPLAEAFKSSIPIVALVQDVPRAYRDKNAFQEFDHLALFQPCAKWVRRIDDPDRVDDYVDLAFTAAATGRPGPAVLLLPVDLLKVPAVVNERRTISLGHFPLDRCAPEPRLVQEAAELLASAKRPVIVAGGGVHVSQAADEVAELSAVAGIPVVTTNMGKGAVDESQPMSAGVFGNCMGDPSPGWHLRDLVSEADVVLLLGTRTAQNGTDEWRLFKDDAKFIHVDIDGLEIGRNYPALRLVADLRLAVRALIREPSLRDAQERAGLVELKRRIAEAKQTFRAGVSAIGSGRQGAIRPEHLMTELNAVLRPTDIVAADASYATNWVTNFLNSQRPGMRFLTPRGLAGLGWGLPLAMGAKLASPQSRVFAVVGDGGFAHCWSELESARRHGVNVIVMVLNNGTLGYQTHAENVGYGGHTDACEFGEVDHAAIARACGCIGERISSPGEIGAALERACAASVPVLLDIMTDPDAFAPMSFFMGKKPLEPASTRRTS